MVKLEYDNFEDFYPVYVSLHKNKYNKMFHFTGVTLSLMCVLKFILTFNFTWLLIYPFIVYPFAWFGHFVFEKNTPAAFSQPLYSKIADLKMCFQMVQVVLGFRPKLGN